MSPRKLLQAAIDSYGSQAKLGAAIGFSQNAVFWAMRNGRVSWEMACMLEHVAGIDRRKFCPDGEVIRRRRAVAVNGQRKGLVRRSGRRTSARKKGRRRS